MVGNYDCASARCGVEIAAVCDTVGHIHVFYNARLIGQNRNAVGVPTRYELAFLDLVAVVCRNHCALNNLVGLKLFVVGVENLDHTRFVEHDVRGNSLVRCGVLVLKLNAAQAFVADCAVVLDLDFGSFDCLSNTADVEGSHCKLRAGLAD